MPYILASHRTDLDEPIEQLTAEIHTVGELNYVVTRLAMRFLGRVGMKYNNIAGVVGTLQLVILEMQRRIIGPYEDQKIQKNGDVPEYEEYDG
jgi:hypothetical protein